MQQIWKSHNISVYLNCSGFDPCKYYVMLYFHFDHYSGFEESLFVQKKLCAKGSLLLIGQSKENTGDHISYRKFRIFSLSKAYKFSHSPRYFPVIYSFGTSERQWIEAQVENAKQQAILLTLKSQVTSVEAHIHFDQHSLR